MANKEFESAETLLAPLYKQYPDDKTVIVAYLNSLSAQQKLLESSAMPITGTPYLANILDVCKPVTESSLIITALGFCTILWNLRIVIVAARKYSSVHII